MHFNINSNTANAALAMFDTETVTVTRRGSGPTPSSTTIYSGAADLQSAKGSAYMSPAGVVDMADAKLAVKANADGTLPDIRVGDAVSDGVGTYMVVNVGAFAFPIKHIEAMLKRGGVSNQGRLR